MKTRIYDFFDTNTMTPKYSYQVFVNDKWTCVAENNKPLLFDIESERDESRKLFSKKNKGIKKVPTSQILKGVRTNEKD